MNLSKIFLMKWMSEIIFGSRPALAQYHQNLFGTKIDQKCTTKFNASDEFTNQIC